MEFELLIDYSDRLGPVVVVEQGFLHTTEPAAT
jgi:hypothetical protein